MEQCKVSNTEGQIIIYKGFLAQKIIMGRTKVFKLTKDDEIIAHLRWDENSYNNILFICNYIDTINKN
tara:strand:+ start:479 stop:682 length:204 start_codon:yes stop_codon:yes gene_type:complete